MYILSKAVKIDRIKITGIKLHKDLYSHARACFEALKGLKLGNAQLKHRDEDYEQALTLRTKNQVIARISVGSTKTTHFYLSWELFPHILLGKDKDVFKQFNDCITEVVGNFASYETAFNCGKVRYIEVAKDFISVPLDSFLPHSPLTRKPYKDDSSKCETTHYVGKDKYTIYDKKFLLEEKKQACEWSNLTRLEVEEHRTDLHPWQLPNLPNLFRGLECADLAALQGIQDPKFKAWLSIAQNRGETFAMRGLTPYQRRKMRACLRQCPADWWNPEKFWGNEWSKALQAIDLQHLLQ